MIERREEIESETESPCGGELSILGLPRRLSGKRIRLPISVTQETGVQSLGQEDPLEEEMGTHSSILA